MKALEMQPLLTAVANLSMFSEKMADVEKAQPGPFNMHTVDRSHLLMALISIEFVHKLATNLGLPVSQALASRCHSNLAGHTREAVIFTSIPHRLVQSLVRDCHQLTIDLGTELSKLSVFALAGQERYAGTVEALFGAQVTQMIPGAVFDLEEASQCMQLARWTASVMHLMRALEAGLRRLADHVNVAATDNWESTIQAIETALRLVRKKVDGQAEEKWAQEAAMHFRFIKNAHRNLVMHPELQYDQEQAEQLWAEARSFLRHIASKLSE